MIHVTYLTIQEFNAHGDHLNVNNSSESDNSNDRNINDTDKKNLTINQKGQNQIITTTTPGWDPCMVPPYC